jgi:cytoskeleton protein RodZ
VSIGNSPPTESSDSHPSVGRALAQARTAAGLTLDQVSTTTRVRVPIVQAIEQNDFSRCGGDVYARGHIRSLARAVGLDPEPLVARYAAEHGDMTEQTVVPTVYHSERIRSEPRRPNWTAAMVVAIVAVIGFVGFTLFSGSSKGDKQSVAGKPSAVSSSAAPHRPMRTKPTTTPVESDSAIAAAPADKVTVKLTADGGKSWIQANDSNGRSLYSGVLKEDASMTFTDEKKIKLVVGNAGAVVLFVNGKDIGPAGGVGQVAHLTYTPGNPEAG